VYGVDGKKLATYTVGVTSGQVSFTLQSQNVYFAGNLVSAEGNAVAADGPSSVRWNAGASHTYYPFGAEYNPTPNNTEKYATYTRDNLTGLDYAMNRYYYSAWGRFMSPDPYNGSAHLGDPQSWNRYTYATNDPINRRDPSGKDDGDPYGGDGEDGCPDGEICIWGGYPPPEPCLADFCATGIGSLPTDPDPTPDPTTPPPDPTDPQDPQPPPPTPTPTPTPPAACEVAVGYVPAIPHLPGFHTFLYLDDDTTGWQVADAGPAQYPHIVVTGSGGIGFSGGFGNLITAVSPTGLYGESTNPNVKYYWEAPESCQLVDELEMDANNLNNIVPYTGLWFGSNWYNSNSFTYTLIQDFALPAGAPPVWAPGWGNYIPH
jgi:RHS repeat-associated protein